MDEVRTCNAMTMEVKSDGAQRFIARASDARPGDARSIDAKLFRPAMVDAGRFDEQMKAGSTFAAENGKHRPCTQRCDSQVMTECMNQAGRPKK